MVSSSKFESLAARFEPYIEELRDFFRNRQLSFGSPADLGPFLERLGEPAFHEEMVSMVRSIVYREGEALPRVELMELIAVAVGGLQVEDADANLYPAFREILAFVTEVSRSQRHPVISEWAAPVNEPEQAMSLPASELGAGEVVKLPEVHVLNSVNPVSAEALSEAETHAGLINDRLSRTLLSIAAPEETETPASVRTEPAHPESEPAAPHEYPVVQRSQPRLMSVLRHSYWIPGLLLLVLAVVAVLLLKTRTATHQTPPVAAIATPAAPIPKPSAYGSALSPGSGSSSSIKHGPAISRTEPAEKNRGQGEPFQPAGGRASYVPLVPRAESGSTNVPSSTARSTMARTAGATPSLGGLLPREGVFLASSGSMASHLVSAPAPGYPKLASFTHTEGQVIVQVVVGRDGKVEATRVLDGPRLLRGAAEHAIRRWRYRPYLVDGRATDVATIVTVNFRLRP